MVHTEIGSTEIPTRCQFAFNKIKSVKTQTKFVESKMDWDKEWITRLCPLLAVWYSFVRCLIIVFRFDNKQTNFILFFILHH